MSLYDIPQLVASFRSVRRDTIQVAEEIPEADYGYRPSAASRSVAETLVHIADGRSINRFELLLGSKEHELQHRAQLTVIQRLLGLVPHFTRALPGRKVRAA